MRISFDRQSPTKLRKHGIGLSFSTPKDIPDDFAAETPSIIAGTIYGNLPVKIGAFSTSFGGQLRNVEIGRYCSLSGELQTGLDEHPIDWVTSSMVSYVRNIHGWQDFLGRPDYCPTDGHSGQRGLTRIGNDVWSGLGVVIRTGVTVGDGAIIGARSLVLNDIPPYAIVGGAPAKLIRYRFPQKIIEGLQGLAWWRFNIMDIPSDLIKRPQDFIPYLEDAIAAGKIREYEPGWISAARIKEIVEGG
jgi:acetyltransferase-like isoleucine patch superfamily enzyme